MTQIRINLNISQQTVDKVTELFKDIPAVFATHQPAFKRIIAQRADASLADQALAEAKAIGKYTPGQMKDFNSAIAHSPCGNSQSYLAEVVREKTLNGEEFQTIIDWLLGN